MKQINNPEVLTITQIPRPEGNEGLSLAVAKLYADQIYKEELDDVLYQNTYRPRMQQGATVAAFNLEGNIIGAGTVLSIYDKHLIASLAVDEAYQRDGVGRKILGLLEDYCVGQGAHRLDANVLISAYDFYEKTGYKALDDENVFKLLVQ